MTVLVTGASGFLGQRVVAALVSRGHRVRALVRPASAAAVGQMPAAVEAVLGDVRDGGALASAVDGCDAVVHLAAAMSGSDEERFATTVGGTERLLEAIQGTSLRRFVLASSFSVYDVRGLSGVLDEESPIEDADLYERDGYAISKLWQERIVRRAAQSAPWTLAVLRPGFIWGPGMSDIAGIGQRIGRCELVIGPRRQLPITYVTNAADAFALAVDADIADGTTVNIVDDEFVTAWRWQRQMRVKTDRAIAIPIPYSAALAVTRLAQAISRTVFAAGGKLPSILVPRKFEPRFMPLSFTNRAARDALGWEPVIGFSRALELCAAHELERR